MIARLSLTCTLLLLGSVHFGWSDQASACAARTEAGQRADERRQANYLRRHSDRVVVGTFRVDPAQPQDDEYRQSYLDGFVEVERRGRVDRYRIRVRQEINCGFPYYFLKGGEHGRFWLERDFREHNDRDDGVIDNYNYVHFESTEAEH